MKNCNLYSDNITDRSLKCFVSEIYAIKRLEVSQELNSGQNDCN